MNRVFHSLWDMLLSKMIDKARAVLQYNLSFYCTEMISSNDDDDDDADSMDSWYSTNEPVEHHPIDEVVDTVDTPSDVTDPDTLINEQSFSQASPVEHHPTASDEATCTTALKSTHGRDQHTTGEHCHLCL